MTLDPVLIVVGGMLALCLVSFVAAWVTVIVCERNKT